MTKPTVEKYFETLKKHAAKQGLEMNPDWEVVEPLLVGLLENGERHVLRTCPCRLAAGDKKKDLDIVCPCAYAKPDVDEYGACYCILFVSDDWATGKIPQKTIPERRPLEKILDI